MRYDLLDIDSGNLFGRFQTEEEALALVLALVDANGPTIIDRLVLGGRDGVGRVLPSRSGADLVRDAKAKRHEQVRPVRRA